MDDGPPEDLYKVPPHNFEAEMALLAAILTNNSAYDQVVGIVRAEHFADQRHGRIFAAIAKLRKSGVVADPITLKDHFAATGELDDVGGAAYLARLAAGVVAVVAAPDYAWVIYDRALRRDLIMVAQDLLERARRVQIDEGADKIGAETVGVLTTILGQVGGSGPIPIATAAQAAIDASLEAHRNGSAIIGVRTYIDEIDEAIGGLKPGRFYVIGGRPGMGKTTLIKNICSNNGAVGEQVVLFQLEEQPDETGAGSLAISAGISAYNILQGRFDTESLDRIFDAHEQMKTWSYHVDCTPGLSVTEIEARARPFRPKLVVVDHLQLVNGAAPGEQYRSMTEKVGAASGALKRMAKRLGCAVVALAQMPRPEKGKEDRRPLLEDLRWSGEIEQDADMVAFVYRAHYYLEAIPVKERDHQWHQDYDRTMNVTEFIIRKLRGGPGANRTIECHYDPKTGIFQRRVAEAEPDKQSAQYSFGGDV